MIKRQKLIGIIASVLLAGVGTTLLVTYVRGAEHRATAGEEQTTVLVVADPIPKGTTSETMTGMVKTQQVPAKVVAEGAMADLGPVAGQVTLVDLLPGEQLVLSRFAAPAEAAGLDVPPGMLQVTVAMDAVRALGGQIRGGDSIGLLASFDDPQTTHLVLHKVRVTDVRDAEGVPVTTEAGATSPLGTLLVTLALDAGSVERVVFAAEFGRLWMSSEPADANEGGTKIQTMAGVNL